MTDRPRLIGRKEAAAYLGIAESTFSMWVANHKMPPAVHGTRKWDKNGIDAKLDEIAGLAPAQKEDAYDAWMRQNNGTSGHAGLTEWRRQKEEREKYRPTMKLNQKLETILLFMVDHPECDTVDAIPGAGAISVDRLIEKGAVRLVGISKKGFRYAVTDEGREEAARIIKWIELQND